MQARGESQRGLRILITNRILLTRTGTEVYVRDLATSLLGRGHLPIVYSPHLGEMAAEIRGHTIPVVDDLAQVGTPPDVIHGHHGPETLAALLAFPGVPAVAVCHSWWAGRKRRCDSRVSPATSRSITPAATAWCASTACPTRRCTSAERRRPRASRPRSTPGGPGPRAGLRNAGRRLPAGDRGGVPTRGIAVDVAGFRAGKVLDRPEQVIGQYDLVFAKARRLEAAAVGTAVVWPTCGASVRW